MRLRSVIVKNTCHTEFINYYFRYLLAVNIFFGQEIEAENQEFERRTKRRIEATDWVLKGGMEGIAHRLPSLPYPSFSSLTRKKILSDWGAKFS